MKKDQLVPVRTESQHSESIRESVFIFDKMQASSTIIFSIANTMMGPSVLLLPLKFIEVGILTSMGVALVIGLISYRTCDLTHLHTRLDEIEYLTAIERILGKVWMYIYFIHSLVILWMAGIIYFLSLCDVTYSCLQMIFTVSWPDEGTITFDGFSYQYIGLIIMGLIGWLFFLPKLGKLLDLTEKGIYSIIAESIFLIFLGFKAIAGGSVKFAFHTDDTTQEVPFTTSKSISYTIGVFAMAFSIHNSIVAIVRKNKTPAKNSRDVGLAYAVTFVVYIITGIFGTIGLYDQSNLNPNTVLNNTLYQRNETATRVLLIITQIMTAFQLVTVLPVVNNIVRTQFFIMIWGENGVPPKWAFIGFNMVYIASFLLVQIFNISPNTVMSYGGAFIGFVIMYLVPVGIHFKALRDKQILDKQGYSTLSGDTSSGNVRTRVYQIAEFLRMKRNINYWVEYGVHGVIMAIGTYIFIDQLISVFSS